MPAEAARSGSIYGSTADPCTVVLFGASGDLAKRKVIPALYDLALHNSLGPRYSIVGFARTPMNDETFRAAIGEAAKTISEVGPIDPAKWNEFASNLYYSAGDYGDQNAYANLAKRLAEIDAEKSWAATGSSISPPLPKSTRTSSSSWAAPASPRTLPPIPGCASLSKSRLAATWPPRAS